MIKESVNIPKMKYGELLTRLRDKAEQKRFPLRCLFELTHNCNHNCVHCYVVKEPRKREISTQEAFVVLDELAEAGCFHVGFTGGEIFTRSDTLEIIEYAQEKGFKITLLTNGTLITPTIADKLKDLGLNKIDITLHATSKEVFERITRVSGSFDKCMKAIQLLMERKIHLCLKYNMMTLNKDEFDKVRELANSLRKKGVDFRYNYSITPRVDCSRQPLEFQVKAYEVARINRKNFPVNLDKVKINKEQEQNFAKENKLFICGAGKTEVSINPYGEIKPCVDLPSPRYNILKDGFFNAWKKLVEYIDKTNSNLSRPCINCELEKWCSWCPAKGYLETGKINSCSQQSKKLALIQRKEEVTLLKRLKTKNLTKTRK